ncbi:MAG: tetratricopeptide repeat protein [Planctomycetota bacterium]|nr:MAG: tetratricopeptide repeat protein [Planctomycetota bacterium]REK23190.1 MAG: tetratricopeptide repeat protein [Planctomycetota bacterium]REK30892.1 MAG: tetratricopeptide repeat protein [Planctomycetota bacterium]
MVRTIATAIGIFASTASAQEVGDFITVTAAPEAKLTSDGQRVAAVVRGTQFRILRVERGSFLVEWKHQRAWISADDVIAIEGSIEYFTKAIEADPTAVDFNARGLAWSHEGKLERSIEDFNEAIRLDPQQARFWSDRGVSRHRLGDLDGAIADYTEAIRLDPGESHFWFSRGLARAYQRDYDRAVEDYDEAIQRDPRNFIYFHSRGASLSSRGDYDKAIADYDKALELNPDYAPTYYNRASASEKKGNFKQATDDYLEALRLAPLYTDALNNFAWLLATCPDEEFRDGERAVEFAQAAGKLSAWKKPYSYGTLAAAYAENGEFDRAVESQRKAIELADDSDKDDFRSRLELYEAGKPYHREQVE